MCLFSVCREQWIRAKYERKEFVDGDEAVCVRQPSYLSGQYVCHGDHVLRTHLYIFATCNIVIGQRATKLSVSFTHTCYKSGV